ncbi:dynamin family protein [Helicobacter salomonis]|uniref:dynamin family protein n=1 Tax=Helicobacter salomonis TaxID=56878 RepID=UPI000CF0D13D|nr:dynamin family protein [Helicobacter salomonis]
MQQELKIVSAVLSAQFQGEDLGHFNQAIEKFRDLSKKIAIPNELDVLLRLQALENEIFVIAAYPELFQKHIIAVGGGFSAGKSQFVNSLLGASIQLPIGMNPTTAIPSYVMDADQEQILGISKNNAVVDLGAIAPNILDQLSHNAEQPLQFGFNLKDILPFMVVGTSFENKAYADICFIDTPGYNPDNNANKVQDLNTAKEFLSNSSAILWLTAVDASAGNLTSSDLEFLKALDLENKKLYIVVSKADMRAQEDLDLVKEHIKDTLEMEGMEYEGISLYSAVEKQEYGFDKISLEEFLSQLASHKHTMSQRDIIEALDKEVYQKYKATLDHKRAQAKQVQKAFHSIRVELGAIDDAYAERTEKIESYMNTIKNIALGEQEVSHEQLAKDFEQAFMELKTSVDALFGRVYEVEEGEEASQTYAPQTTEELEELLKDESIPLSAIDISALEDISGVLSNLTSLRSQNFEGLEGWNFSHVNAQTHAHLAILYCESRGVVAQDYTKAIEHYQKAGEMGCAEAYCNLGFMYYDSRGVPQDYVKAKEYWEKATEMGNSGACCNLGSLYEKGQGVAQDYSKAVEYYQKAAEMGSSAAYNNLGLMYFAGQGVAQDDAKAFEYREIAKMMLDGKEPAEAYFEIGLMYDLGKGVQQDFSKALEYYQKAAKMGSAGAYRNLGILYKNGEGVAQDYAKAMECYQKATSMGNARACHSLAVMYDKGQGAPQSDSKALEYYQKSGEMGYAAGYVDLGYMYENGQGVSQNYAKALECYQKGADMGHGVGYYNLGVMYENGYGVAQDRIKAKECYQKAIESGNEKAIRLAQKALSKL